MKTPEIILKELNANSKEKRLLDMMAIAKSKSWRKDLQKMYFNNSLRLERTKN